MRKNKHRPRGDLLKDLRQSLKLKEVAYRCHVAHPASPGQLHGPCRTQDPNSSNSTTTCDSGWVVASPCFKCTLVRSTWGPQTLTTLQSSGPSFRAVLQGFGRTRASTAHPKLLLTSVLGTSSALIDAQSSFKAEEVSARTKGYLDEVSWNWWTRSLTMGQGCAAGAVLPPTTFSPC